jgi:hypothetical protein
MQKELSVTSRRDFTPAPTGARSQHQGLEEFDPATGGGVWAAAGSQWKHATPSGANIAEIAEIEGFSSLARTAAEAAGCPMEA